MKDKIVILGGGGHAKVVIDVIRRIGCFEFIGYTDPGVGALGQTSYLGTDDSLDRLRRDGITHAFVALGDNELRVDRADHLRRIGFLLPTIVCPTSVISSSAQIGAGVLIMSGCVVNADACIGDFTIINTRASVDHDCVVGAGAHVGPGALLAGNVAIGELAFVGAGATIVNSASVGPRAIVAAGSVVTRKVDPDVVVGGVPAKPLRTIDRRAAATLDSSSIARSLQMGKVSVVGSRQ